jgi:hypothetical protein
MRETISMIPRLPSFVPAATLAKQLGFRSPGDISLEPSAYVALLPYALCLEETAETGKNDPLG